MRWRPVFSMVYLKNFSMAGTVCTSGGLNVMLCDLYIFKDLSPQKISG
jgi:hypothetical protein